ncbi:MAG TPA: hypothetical protein DHV65_05065, partial [Ktedonobacter sp.]|nr:hypothetical protein [Ktedonobacter sp.]
MYWPKLHVHTAIIVRIILITLFMFASSTLIWYLLAGAHLAVHASSPTIRETTLPSPIPWGVSFDASGNVWVAEPGCDPTPICSPQQAPGNIAQYNRQNFSLVQNYAEPGGYAPPLFLAVDTNGAIWFTEPSINAIGELMPNNGNPTWKQYIVPTPNASPYDLTFDQAGNLWFTEFTASKIGEFNPATQVFTETPTPTPNSNPYGIVGPDSNTGAIWFTENNSAVSQIGRFTPPLSGTLSTTSIDE